MTDHEYINKSINSLVEELNSLGNKSVLIQKTELMAFQKGENKKIRRFQSKSIPRNQFFKFNQHDKKYFYDHVISDFNKQSLKGFLKYWQQGYNTTVLIQNNNEYLIQLLKNVIFWAKECLVFCVALNQHNQLFDIFGQVNLTHRELLDNKKYYEIEDNKKVEILTNYLQSYFNNEKYQQEKTLIDITFKNPNTCAQLHLMALPSQFFNSDCSPPYSLIKTQLIQLLNYIKMNPNKRYEHISKLITKRLPMTNYLTKILMSDSCNIIINFIEQDQNYQQEKSVGKFQLFDKLSIITNLLRKADRSVIEYGTLKSFKAITESQKQKIDNRQTLAFTRARNSKSDKQNNFQQQFISPIARLNLKTQNDKNTEERQIQSKQRQISQKQFQFCRSLERKTHKYSISPRQQALSNRSKDALKANKNTQFMTDKLAQTKTITKYQSFQSQNQFANVQISKQQDLFVTQKNKCYSIQNNVFSQSQQINLLKAQHARQISQYHQTIQSLNKKIMILTKDLNLQELYKIHQKQIMLLQLKIKELREDIQIISNQESNEKGLKSIVKKLTEEIKSYESASISKKLSQSRTFMTQKQLKQLKQKLVFSEKARSLLNLQVQTLTKRLKIRDSEIQKINQQDIEKYQAEDLSTTEESIFQQVKKLTIAVRNQQRNSAEYLLRKVSLILSDLSKSRDVILQCNDFLVQLMEILDEKLSKKAPQIVLDCNKFIRGFLMDNLSIF